ncbi:uncharacterized protein LOC104440064 [Eucalyptus grandis]|uniref:uncharacterized protein LOC104440064 n=1 Tax=Eucalyptus grandis TaxID=71139 RepID=UPI00192ED0FA|nr:uncharacterized protein LOC104440064 [Eucalyptus grandis]
MSRFPQRCVQEGRLVRVRSRRVRVLAPPGAIPDAGVQGRAELPPPRLLLRPLPRPAPCPPPPAAAAAVAAQPQERHRLRVRVHGPPLRRRRGRLRLLLHQAVVGLLHILAHLDPDHLVAPDLAPDLAPEPTRRLLRVARIGERAGGMHEEHADRQDEDEPLRADGGVLFGSLLRPGCHLAAPVTPRAESSPRYGQLGGGGGLFDLGESHHRCEEEPLMERVESGRDLRAKMYAKLSKGNSLDGANLVGPGSGPDVGWVSELVM